MNKIIKTYMKVTILNPKCNHCFIVFVRPLKHVNIEI